MFGHSVTTYGQYSAGIYGYIIAIDLSKLYIKSISGIQPAVDSGGLYNYNVETNETSLVDLQDYINDVDCPMIAYAIASDIIYIFFRNTELPYSSSTLFTIYGIRYPKPVTSLSQNLDIRENETELLFNYALKQASLYNNKRLDPDIELNIKYLETKLKG